MTEVPRPWGVGQPAYLKLHQFARIVLDAFGEWPVLVGSALEKKNPRDVDVRLRITDSHFMESIGPVAAFGKPGTRWASLALAYSALGKEMTGRPIDFQIQPACIWLAYEAMPMIVLDGNTP